MWGDTRSRRQQRALYNICKACQGAVAVEAHAPVFDLILFILCVCIDRGTHASLQQQSIGSLSAPGCQSSWPVSKLRDRPYSLAFSSRCTLNIILPANGILTLGEWTQWFKVFQI